MTKMTGPAALLVAALVGFGGHGAALAAEMSTPSPDAAAPPAAAPTDPDALTDPEKAAFGCGLSAATSMVFTYLAGPTEIALLWGGGTIIPSGSVMLAMVLLGQIGATACGIGLLATPAALWVYDQSGNMAARLIQVSERAGRHAVEALLPVPTPDRQVAEGAPAL